MKRNLLKAIGISFLIFVILSWIIPVGTYSGKLATDGTDPVGFFDLFSVPAQTLVTFALYGVAFAAIGGFYGVIKKTGALDVWTDKITKKFDGKEKGFLVFTILFFVILSSLTGLTLPLFLLVPLFGIVLSNLNYDKITSFASTVGSILVGSIGTTYGFNIMGYTKNLLGLSMNTRIAGRIILLVIATAFLIFFVLRNAKKKEPKLASASKKDEVMEIKEEPEVKASSKKTSTAKKATSKKTTKKSSTKKSTAKKTTAKKTTAKKSTKKSTTKALAVVSDTKKIKTEKRVSSLPLIIFFCLMIIVLILGMYNWYYSFNIKTFNNLHSTVTGIKIGKYKLFENLLSSIGAFGNWGNVEFISIVTLTSIIIAWIYKLSVNDFVEAYIKGVKKMLPTAIYAALANVILMVLSQAAYSGSGTIATTVFDKILGMSSGFNVILTSITSFIGGFFYNDLYYLLSAIAPFVSSYTKAKLGIAGAVIQSSYALSMLIFPTSVILIAGLSYFDVKFKEWFKYIWKYALIIFITIIVIGLLMLA